MDDKITILNKIEALGSGKINPTHAYISLFMSMMDQFMMSSDTKYFILLDAKSKLEEFGYSEEDVNIFMKKILDITKENIKINDFMG